MNASPEKAPRKQQQRSIETRQKLLDAALMAFSENGFKGTSTRDIAERAGVHHPLITYHFKNKEELWRAAVDQIFSRFSESLFAARKELEGKDLRDIVAVMIRTYVHNSAAEPYMHKIMAQEGSRPNQRLDYLVDTYLRPHFKVAIQDFAELQEQGYMAKGDPALLFNMMRMTAGCLLAFSLEVKGTSDIDFQEPGKLDELADTILRVFVRDDRRK